MAPDMDEERWGEALTGMETAGGHVCTVVAIDDDPRILLLIQNTLEDQGMVCRTALTAEAGHRLILASKPDLVLLGIVLGGEDGFALCRELRRAWSKEELPVVMVAEIEELSSIEAAYASGANDYLAKPLKWKHLPYRLRHTLQASRDLVQRRETEAALRKSEERYRAQFNLASEGILVHTLQGAFLEVNEAFARMHGYSREELLSMKLKDLNQPGTFRKVPERLARILAGEALTFEVKHLHKDGRIVPFEVSASLIASGDTSVILAFHREITERKRAEEEKARLQAQLNQAQKMESLGILAGGIAHDMNNVLGAILGMASANLAAQPQGSSAHRAFDTIAQAAVRGGIAVKSLLRFAHQTPAEEHELNLNEVLQEEIRLLERTTLSRIDLVLDLAPDLLPIRGDVSTLANAIMNLCVNAVDAIPGQGTLTLRTRNAGTDWIEVSVEDDGAGMSREVLEKALDPFFTTKPTGKGTGLGLSMVYSTVKAHQGRMDLQSELGKGTRVTLHFPACAASHEASEEGGAQESRPRTGPLRVLLVDDDELILSSIEEILVVLGHPCTSAASGEEALAKLEAGLEVDLVIMDLNMPGLGGRGTLQALRALRPDLPVLVATGQADQAAMDLVASHAKVSLLPKPFTMKELQGRLERRGRA